MKRGKSGESRAGALGKRLGRLVAVARDIGRSGLPALFGLFGGAVLAAALLLWLVERGSPDGLVRRLFDGVWWAIVTIGTVGYGDIYPRTDGGRLVAILLIVSGIVLTALISGTVASIFVERRIREGKGLQDLKLKGHLLVCGWNPDAESFLADLEARRGAARRPVVLCNWLESGDFDALRARFPALDLRFVRGDFTQEATLARAAAREASACVVIPDLSGGGADAGNDERTVLGCLAIRSLAPDLPLSAAISKPASEQHLRRAKVDNIVVNGELAGFLLSAASLSKALPRAARRLLAGGDGAALREVPMPREYAGKTFAEASAAFLAEGRGILVGLLSEEKGVSLEDILGDDSSAIDSFIKRKFQEASIDLGAETKAGDELTLAPPPGHLIREGDTAFVIGAGGDRP